MDLECLGFVGEELAGLDVLEIAVQEVWQPDTHLGATTSGVDDCT